MHDMTSDRRQTYILSIVESNVINLTSHILSLHVKKHGEKIPTNGSLVESPSATITSPGSTPSFLRKLYSLVARCGNRTRYTLRDSRLPSHRTNSAVEIKQRNWIKKQKTNKITHTSLVKQDHLKRLEKPHLDLILNGRFLTWTVNEQTDHLMVSNCRRPWTPDTPEALQVHCRPSGVFVKLYNDFSRPGRDEGDVSDSF
uniref:SFRICE_025023 n=1 Tax=Spodoptera frugiperda TaxID=7108 RepID=A0A2H1VDY0_SPOFR